MIQQQQVTNRPLTKESTQEGVNLHTRWCKPLPMLKKFHHPIKFDTKVYNATFVHFTSFGICTLSMKPNDVSSHIHPSADQVAAAIS